MPGGELSGAKRAYRSAKAEGNHQEEARWANVIGDILKNRGEYVQALKWLRIDYDVSMKFLSQKQVLPTCQSLGEVYLRLQCFKDALIYQKKHLELARDACDIVEEQRASTQLGRTYHEMFLRSEDDHYSIRNAKKYFKNAMRLAQDLKEKSQCNKSSFLKEYVDAHNNIGMLEMDLDNLEEAQKILTRGLEICNEEEVIEDDDGRSRLHHNLGNVYMELRKWDKAQEHIEKDIIICKRIKHCQGEAKGYVNLGELHYRVQKYDEAILCYQKALDVAKSMEDEDALVSQIHQNIETVKEAMKVMDELKMEEQNLKKLTRNIAALRGTPGERKCLLQKNACIDHLIDKSSTVFAWKKHLEFAKRKKIIASELCDKEKLGDAYLALGDSYQKLRIFNKALKWYSKSWDMYKAIVNKEGQALVKINIGDVLDSDGDWVGALEAFEEGYRIAVQENLSSVQISAIENMHYSHMIRFDNVEEARRLQLLIDKLKQSNNVQLKKQTLENDCCSESDTEGGDNVSCSRSNASISLGMSETSSKSQFLVNIDKGKDDVPLISPIQSSRTLSKLKADHVKNINIAPKSSETSPKCLSKSTNTHQMVVARKRARVVSDDEDEKHEVEQPKEKLQKGPTKVIARSDELTAGVNSDSPACHYKIVNASNFAASSCTPDNLEESSCSHKCQSSMVPGQNGEDFRILSTCKAAIASKIDASSCKCDVDAISKLASSDNVNAQIITLKIDNEILQVEADSFTGADLSIESIKTEVACLYYLQLPKEKRSKGLLPIIRHMECGGRALESIEEAKSLKEHAGRFFVEVLIDGWVQRRLMKLYVDSCNDLSEAPNMKLLKKLYNLEVSEDEVIVSGCDLQDISVVPLLNAMHAYKTVAALDLSHNLLGNGTLEKLQRVLATSGQKYGSLILDLHCNQFGPTALFQVCECPVLLTRLEVLNISGNRLTDACGCYLSTILENCKALYSLNIERCSITSRTIQKIADSLNGGCALSQLAIGYNNPISRNAFASLLAKLSALERFSELNLNGLKLSKMAVGSICLLAKACSLSGLMLGGTSIGTDSALLLNESLFDGTQELVKLDLSYCGLTSRYVTEVNAKFALMGGLSELNLGGNPIMQEGSALLALLLKNAQCCLKVLVLDKCQLALPGVIQIIQALADNESLEELNVAGNTDMEKCHTLPEPDLIAEGTIETLASNLNPPESSAEVASVYEKDRIRKLSAAIGMANQLKFLDLSDNGLTAQVAESLYALWSTSRTCLTTKHIKEQTVHLSVQGIRCCKVKPCCKRD